jgi:hypothetical protein
LTYAWRLRVGDARGLLHWRNRLRLLLLGSLHFNRGNSVANIF